MTAINLGVAVFVVLVIVGALVALVAIGTARIGTREAEERRAR